MCSKASKEGISYKNILQYPNKVAADFIVKVVYMKGIFGGL